MTDDPGFYDRAIRRLERIGFVLAGAAVVSMAAREGWRGALGATAGAAFSLTSFRNWKRVAGAASGGKSRIGPWPAIRFLVLAASLFVIIRYFGVSPWSVLAGLFVSVAAVMVEIVFELIFPHR
jgi:hypothetical protein